MSSDNSLLVDEFEANGLEVVGEGRATIPAKLRRKYGATEGSTVDVDVTTESGHQFGFEEATITVRGRVCIPARFRDRYGIEKGDYVDITVKEPGNVE